jgi:hypothetical protein
VKVLSQIVRLAYISKSETYYKLEEHYEKATPSLSQRAYLIAGSLELTNYMSFVFYGFLVAVIALAAFITYPSNTTVQVFRNEINDIVAVAIFTSIVLALIYFFLYRRNIQRLKDWQPDYLEQSYIIVFETILPKGNTTSEKVLNLSRAVFPELIESIKLLAAKFLKGMFSVDDDKKSSMFCTVVGII